MGAVQKRSILIANHGKKRMPAILGRLRDAGFEVLTARNLPDTCEILKEKRPDIILLRPSSEPVQAYELKAVLEQIEAKQEVLLHVSDVPDLRSLNRKGVKIDDFIRGNSPKELMARIELAVQRIEQNADWQRLVDILEEKSKTDYKTELLNDRGIIEQLKVEFERADRYRLVLSILLVDLDDFKILNDTEGHPFADFVLQAFAQEMKHLIRHIDIPGRYGGDEFLVILPYTGLDEAAAIAERIRVHFEHHTFERNGQRARITVSMGVNTYTGGLPAASRERSAEDLADRCTEFLKGADSAALEAKRRGKNRICYYPLMER
jgi:diguanylate cyclase (GGDEF)-like protein